MEILLSKKVKLWAVHRGRCIMMMADVSVMMIMVGDGEKMGCGDSSTSRCVPGIFF